MKYKRFTLLILLVCSFFTLSAQNNQALKLVLITDIHLNRNNETPREKLRECIQDINAQRDIDLVLIGGDITESGDSLSLAIAKEELDHLHYPYRAVAGNHETKWSSNLATAFKKIYGYDQFVYDLKGYRIVGINTGPIIRMMDGHLYPADLSFLEKSLSNMPQGYKGIVLTHYPLKSEDVDNWYDGTTILKRHPVSLVIGGHYHSNRLHHYDGIPGILGRSSLPDREGKTGYTIITLADNSVTVMEKHPREEPVEWGTLKLGYQKDMEPEELPSYQINEEYGDKVEEIWTYKNDEAFMCAPATTNGKIFVADDAGKVLALDSKNGHLIWSFKTNGRIVGAPDAGADVVVVGSADGNLYCLNADNGELEWETYLGAPISGAAKLYRGIIYVGDTSGTMHAVGICTGKRLWSNKVANDYIETRPTISNGKLLFGAWDGHFYALNLKDGKKLWSWVGPKTGMHFSPAAVWPVETNGVIFFTAPDRVLSAISTNDGSTLNRYDADKVRETIALSSDRRRIYSKTMQDSVLCFSASPDLKLLWRANPEYGYDHAASMPIEVGSDVVVVTKNGFMAGLDPFKGYVNWKYKVGNTLINTPVAIGQDQFVYTAADGKVGVIKIKR